MRRKLDPLVLVAAALVAVPAAADPLRVEQAQVTTADGRRLLYRETHYVDPVAGSGRWVLYSCPDGRPFARKQVRGAGMAPDFTLEDGRDGYREGVTTRGGARTAFVAEAGKTRSAPLASSGDAVIDAGFDAAVRTHWNALLRGTRLRMQFLVPSRQRYFPVQVEHAGNTQWHGIPAERLRMRVDAWFGFAVPAVELLYARDDRRLLEFRGTGNLRDARGNHPQVRIRFDKQPAAAAASELAGIRRLALDGKCTI